jgi:hypothetical protein
MKNLIAALCLLLAGCGQIPSAAPVGPKLNELPGIDVLLLNPAGVESPPRESEGGRAPFGILVSPGAKLSFCTVSHLPQALVLTSAHCFPDKKIEGARIVYFDTGGKKRSEPVESAVYIGDMYDDDVAVVKISARASANWDETGEDIFERPNRNAVPPGGPFDVKVWAFDPIRRYPDLEAKIGKRAAVFAPKICSASFKQPSYDGENAYEIWELGKRDPPGNRRLFYDGCDPMPSPGNSGSLVTLLSTGASLAVHQMSIGPTLGQVEDYDGFDYRSTKGKFDFIPSQPFTREVFYWAGISLSQFTSRDNIPASLRVRGK